MFRFLLVSLTTKQPLLNLLSQHVLVSNQEPVREDLTNSRVDTQGDAFIPGLAADMIQSLLKIVRPSTHKQL